MRYLNQKLGQLGGLLPDLYDALSISDFLAARHQIPRPSKGRITSAIFGKNINNLVQIDFANVQLTSARGSYIPLRGSYIPLRGSYIPLRGSYIPLGWILSDEHHELFLYPLYLYRDPFSEELTRHRDGTYDRVRVNYALTGNGSLGLVRPIGFKSSDVTPVSSRLELERRLISGEEVLVIN